MTDQANDDLRDILKCVTAGDHDAFQIVVRRFERLLWSVCWSAGLSCDDAEDVAQVVWIRFLENATSIREPERLAGWLATTAHRQCLKHLQQRARTTPTDKVPELNISTDASDDLVKSHIHTEIRHALTRASERCRLLLALLLHEPPLEYAEISTTLNMPVGSIGPTRQRCLDRLRRDPGVLALWEGTT